MRPGYQGTGADNLHPLSRVIKPQTAMNPGNSGGPLLNDRGEIIGVNSFRGEGEGLNYAVAVDVVEAFLQKAQNTMAPPAPTSPPSAYRTEAHTTKTVGVVLNVPDPPADQL